MLTTTSGPERARRKHPGGHNPLDDLCARYGVDRSHRTRHGALLDAKLLAAVYVELTTTRQAALQLDPIRLEPSNIKTIIRAPLPLPPRVTADDRNAHRAFVQTLGSEAVWCDYLFRGRRNSTTQIPQAAQMQATAASK